MVSITFELQTFETNTYRWYALIFGEHTDIDVKDLEYPPEVKRPAPRKSIAFWRLEYEKQSHPDIYAKIRQKFEDLAKTINFRRYSGHISCENGDITKFDDGVTFRGLTYLNTLKKGNTMIYIHLELI